MAGPGGPGGGRGGALPHRGGESGRPEGNKRTHNKDIFLFEAILETDGPGPCGHSGVVDLYVGSVGTDRTDH